MIKKIRDLIELGYVQVSRRYRTVARLPMGMNGIEAMRSVDPMFVEDKLRAIEEMCVDQFRRVYSKDKVELDIEEFDEFLRQTGRRVLAVPFRCKAPLLAARAEKKT